MKRDDDAKGSYTYPNSSDDPDKRDVLKNRLNIRSHSRLREAEYAFTAIRQSELATGAGPKGQFDAAHLKAIHGYIFQDVYEWAGHTRNERPIVEGERVEPVGTMSKGTTTFLHGSRMDMGLTEALKPISNAETLRNANRSEFIERAANTLAELNYVHPFREGNGRAQEAFIQQLGREYGHEVDMTVITKVRMQEASIATTQDPSSPQMKHLLQDAIEPNRREALRLAMSDLETAGQKPFDHNIKTASAGDVVQGPVLGHDNHVASIVTNEGIIVADRADLPERLPSGDEKVSFTARSDFQGRDRSEQSRHKEDDDRER